MSNNPADDRPRKKGQSRGGQRRQGPRRNAGGANAPRQPGPQQAQPPGGRGERHGQPRGNRLSREEIEWARDLFQHGEPPEEIADQLGIRIEQVEELIAGWTR